MIADPINDADCLGQLTTIARELASTTLARTVARHLGSRDAVIRWIQAKPQADDDGSEPVRYIVCDVPQRVRLFAETPNCVERATDAAILLQALEDLKLTEPLPRALGTVEHPMRHTGLVEKRGEHWYAVDLFPRRNARARNFDWGKLGGDVLQGAHNYVGKPILQFYGLGGVADTIGENENKLIGRDKKNEKKDKPPTGASGGFRPPPNTGSPPASGGGNRKLAIWTGALTPGTTSTKGGNGNGKGTETRESKSGDETKVAAGGDRDHALDAAAGGDRDPHDEGAEAQRVGGWWGWPAYE